MIVAENSAQITGKWGFEVIGFYSELFSELFTDAGTSRNPSAQQKREIGGFSSLEFFSPAYSRREKGGFILHPPIKKNNQKIKNL